jgi:ribosomal protein L34
MQGKRSNVNRRRRHGFRARLQAGGGVLKSRRQKRRMRLTYKKFSKATV